eukprot:gene16041-16210_t
MANFGLTDLRLVNPKLDKCDPKAIAMAVGADDILNKAAVFSALSEATADLTHIFGTTATIRQMVKRCYTPNACYKKPIMWRNLKNIFTRMDLTEQEVRTLNG